MYALLGADFLAVAQLVVYVGAIMVLIMFAIFLTPGQIDVPGLVGAGQRVGAVAGRLGGRFRSVSVIVILTTTWNIRPEPLNLSSTAEAIGGLLLTRYVAAVRDRLAAADRGPDRRDRDRAGRLRCEASSVVSLRSSVGATRLPPPHQAPRDHRAASRPGPTDDPGPKTEASPMDFLIPSLRHFLILGTILFSLGMYGVLSRRNAIGILLSIELMLNGVNVLMVAFARYINVGQVGPELAGQVFALFIITQAAAEAAIGLAIVIAIYRQRRTIQVDQLDLMKG